MSDWDSLQVHPAWRKLVDILAERQKLALEEIVAVGLVSSDPRVRAVAQKLDEMEYVVTLPEREKDAEKEQGAEE